MAVKRSTRPRPCTLTVHGADVEATVQFSYPRDGLAGPDGYEGELMFTFTVPPELIVAGDTFVDGPPGDEVDVSIRVELLASLLDDYAREVLPGEAVDRA